MARGKLAAGATLAILASATAAFGQSFERFAGNWSGGGTIRLMSGGTESLRCRGAYSPTGGDQLRLSLACASDSFKVQISSNIVQRGGRIQGTWSEASFGVSGSLSGTARGDRIDANISGSGVSARLSIALRGNVQAVNLISQSQIISGAAAVTLRRR